MIDRLLRAKIELEQALEDEFPAAFQANDERAAGLPADADGL